MQIKYSSNIIMHYCEIPFKLYAVDLIEVMAVYCVLHIFCCFCAFCFVLTSVVSLSTQPAFHLLLTWSTVVKDAAVSW